MQKVDFDKLEVNKEKLFSLVQKLHSIVRAAQKEDAKTVLSSLAILTCYCAEQVKESVVSESPDAVEELFLENVISISSSRPILNFESYINHVNLPMTIKVGFNSEEKGS